MAMAMAATAPLALAFPFAFACRRAAHCCALHTHRRRGKQELGRREEEEDAEERAECGMGGSDLQRAPTFPAVSASRSLHALAVFQHLSNLELIKSVHLYVDDGTFTAIQQEFLLSPGSYSQISEPVPSFFSKFAPMGAEQFMGTLKHLNELDMWHCILEFHSHAPLATSIVPLLSVSRNSALRGLPTLAHDLNLVEKAVESEMQTLKCAALLGHHGSSARDRQGYDGGQASPQHTPSWKPGKWNFSSVSATTGHSSESNDTRGEGLPDGSQLQVETLHEWGSDLELASPRMFDSCILGSSWSTSISSMPLTGLISAPSPTSSMVTNNKAGCSTWSPPSLVLNSLGDYHLESSSSQSNLRHGKLSTNSEMPNVGACLHPEAVAIPVVGKSVAPGKSHKACSATLRRVVERTRSHCSDESVCTPTGSDRQTSGLSLHSLSSPVTNLRLSDCRNEISLHETGSSQVTEPSLSRKDGMTTRNMLEKMSGNSNHHQRGPTERMTEITLSELSNYFNMPITQASKELKVGLTVLKKRCREFGIPRWPHRKMKSLDSLIQNIQELAKGPEGKTSAPVLNAVKELEHQKKRMEERPGIELAERTKRLRQACFKASYKKRRQAQTLAQQESYEVSGAVPVDQCVSTLVS